MANEKTELSPHSQVQAAENEEEEGVLGFGQGVETKQKEEGEQLKPWKQHAAVISIPRYDYAAPSSLLQSSHSGFLITCPIKREKSATKEAISILEKNFLHYGSSTCSNDCTSSQSCSTNAALKKRKLSCKDTDEESAESAGRNGDANHMEISGKVAATSTLTFSDEGNNDNSSLNLSLVKLTRSGLLLLSLPNNYFRNIVDVLSKIFLSLESGELKRPLWCNRIFPIQETCILTEKDLKFIVSKLVKEYLGKEQENLESPIRFAVGYNRRGIEETEMKNSKPSAEGTKMSGLLDRDTCFKIVAESFKDVAKNAIVDLKSPQVAVLVEVLPISVVPLQSIVSAVSILPSELIITKPRLCVKPLISDPKPAKKRN